jgi:enterochelin esterase-like enzyme
MPNAHVLPPTAQMTSFDWISNVTSFREDLLENVIPLIEGRYRVKADAGHRAVAGLSMGAGHALGIGFNDPERFAWVAAMSGGFQEEMAAIPDVTRVNRGLKLLWIGCGRGDDGIEGTRKLVAALGHRGVHPLFRETDGGHTWLVWRENLAEILPLLFRG